MNKVDLLREWPQWKNAGADTIVTSPAFAVGTDFQGSQCILSSFSGTDEDTIDLAVAFESEKCVLSLSDSEAYPDLHRLWSRRRELPGALLLALIEKECGKLLQWLEDQAKRQLSIGGFVDEESNATSRQTFVLGNINFALNLPVCLSVEWGRLENIDTNHPLIRSLTKEVVAEYSSMVLDEKDVEKLAVGDCLLLADDFQNTAQWVYGLDEDDSLHIRGLNKKEITFGEIADGKLPKIPVADSVLIYRKNQVIAEGCVARVGEGKCFKLTHLR